MKSFFSGHLDWKKWTLSLHKSQDLQLQIICLCYTFGCFLCNRQSNLKNFVFRKFLSSHIALCYNLHYSTFYLYIYYLPNGWLSILVNCYVKVLLYSKVILNPSNHCNYFWHRFCDICVLNIRTSLVLHNLTALLDKKFIHQHASRFSRIMQQFDS